MKTTAWLILGGSVALGIVFMGAAIAFVAQAVKPEVVAAARKEQPKRDSIVQAIPVNRVVDEKPVGSVDVWTLLCAWENPLGANEAALKHTYFGKTWQVSMDDITGMEHPFGIEENGLVASGHPLSRWVSIRFKFKNNEDLIAPPKTKPVKVQGRMVDRYNFVDCVFVK